MLGGGGVPPGIPTPPAAPSVPKAPAAPSVPPASGAPAADVYKRQVHAHLGAVSGVPLHLVFSVPVVGALVVQDAAAVGIDAVSYTHLDVYKRQSVDMEK